MIQQSCQRATVQNGRSVEALHLLSTSSAVNIDTVLEQSHAISTVTTSTHESVSAMSADIRDLNEHVKALHTRIDQLEKAPSIEASVIARIEQMTVAGALAAHNKGLGHDANASQPRVAEIVEGENETSESLQDFVETLPRRTRRPRTRVVFRSYHHGWFFDVEVKTIERVSNLKDLGVFSTAMTKTSRIELETQYEIRSKLPFMKRGIAFTRQDCVMPHKGSIPHKASISRQIRTYNIVPNGAPIWAACRNLDLKEVQRLFSSGLASPFDRDEWNETPSYRILGQLFLFPKLSSYQALSAVELLRWYTTACCCESNLLPDLLTFCIIMLTENPKISEQRIEALRLVLQASRNDAWDTIHGARIFLKTFPTPEIQFLLSQSTLEVELCPYMAYLDHGGGYFIESDFQILQDLAGMKLCKAIEHDQNMVYNACSKGLYNLKGLSSLVAVARKSKRRDLREGCYNRIAIAGCWLGSTRRNISCRGSNAFKLHFLQWVFVGNRAGIVLPVATNLGDSASKDNCCPLLTTRAA
jgi:hypothetical protein